MTYLYKFPEYFHGNILIQKTTIPYLKELCRLVAKVKQIYAIPTNDDFF